MLVTSQHLKGIAIDLWVPINEREAFYKAAKEAGFKGLVGVQEVFT